MQIRISRSQNDLRRKVILLRVVVEEKFKEIHRCLAHPCKLVWGADKMSQVLQNFAEYDSKPPPRCCCCLPSCCYFKNCGGDVCCSFCILWILACKTKANGSSFSMLLQDKPWSNGWTLFMRILIKGSSRSPRWIAEPLSKSTPPLS